MPTLDPATAIDQLLASARLEPSEAEVKQMVEDYPQLRKGADSLYLPELDNLEPAVKFNPLDPYR